MNRFIVKGNLTRDPEEVQTKNDTQVARFSIAVNRRGKNERTDFFDVTAFNHTAKNVLEYKKQGDPLLIEGHLQQDTWEDKDSGKKRSKIVVIADNVEFLGRGNGDTSDSGQAKNDAEIDSIPF